MDSWLYILLHIIVSKYIIYRMTKVLKTYQQDVFTLDIHMKVLIENKYHFAYIYNTQLSKTN